MRTCVQRERICGPGGNTDARTARLRRSFGGFTPNPKSTVPLCVRVIRLSVQTALSRPITLDLGKAAKAGDGAFASCAWTGTTGHFGRAGGVAAISALEEPATPGSLEGKCSSSLKLANNARMSGAPRDQLKTHSEVGRPRGEIVAIAQPLKRCLSRDQERTGEPVGFVLLFAIPVA